PLLLSLHFLSPRAFLTYPKYPKPFQAVCHVVTICKEKASCLCSKYVLSTARHIITPHDSSDKTGGPRGDGLISAFVLKLFYYVR
ncbi:hypothetical protein, partial [Candidatus Hakubella thermalkaliphila]|uniref:hypothetical protein n=1 Tax=Candidatus Hakubella thermalkaliphila TaxID=2754717 RepID=UPI001C6116E2